MTTITKPDTIELSKVRRIVFRTSEGKEGCIVGLPLTVDSRQVRIFSAGCLHNVYAIPETATILTMERL